MDLERQLVADVIRAFLVALLFSSPAFAQDWCATSLAVGANPQEVMLFKLRCSLQKLDSERAAAVDQATQNDVATAMANAKLAQSQADLVAMRTKMDGLDAKLKAACGWRGVQNKPMAEVCDWWRKH